MCFLDTRRRFAPLFAPSMSMSPSKSRSESLSSSLLDLLSYEGGGAGGNMVIGILDVCDWFVKEEWATQNCCSSYQIFGGWD